MDLLARGQAFAHSEEALQPWSRLLAARGDFGTRTPTSAAIHAFATGCEVAAEQLGVLVSEMPGTLPQIDLLQFMLARTRRVVPQRKLPPERPEQEAPEPPGLVCWRGACLGPGPGPGPGHPDPTDRRHRRHGLGRSLQGTAGTTLQHFQPQTTSLLGRSRHSLLADRSSRHGSRGLP